MREDWKKKNAHVVSVELFENLIIAANKSC